MSKQALANKMTILMAPAYIERGIQNQLANLNTSSEDVEADFNEWFCDSGTAERIEQHVNFLFSPGVTMLIEGAVELPQADVLEDALEYGLAYTLVSAFNEGKAKPSDEELLTMLEKRLISLQENHAVNAA